MEEQENPSPSRWSELLEELLHRIFARIQLPDDAARFGGVCSSWRAVRNLYRPPPVRLKLIKPYPPQTLTNNNPVTFLYIPDIDVPGPAKSLLSSPNLALSPPPRAPHQSCHVRLFSAFGWLLLLQDPIYVHLVSPNTKAPAAAAAASWLVLPPLWGAHFLYFVAISAPPTADEFVAVCNFDYCHLAYFRRGIGGSDGGSYGGDHWFRFDSSLPRLVGGMQFHGGRLYVLMPDCFLIRVYAFDSPYPRLVKFISLLGDELCLDLNNLCMHYYRIFMRLTECPRDACLLLGARVEFVREWVANSAPEIERVEYRVFRLMVEEEEEGERWVRVILFSRNGMECLDVQRVRFGFRGGGCVYDLDYSRDFLCVYSLEKGDGRYLCWKPLFDSVGDSLWLVPQGW